jgi:hypothetical protein
MLAMNRCPGLGLALNHNVIYDGLPVFSLHTPLEHMFEVGGRVINKTKADAKTLATIDDFTINTMP